MQLRPAGCMTIARVAVLLDARELSVSRASGSRRGNSGGCFAYRVRATKAARTIAVNERTLMISLLPGYCQATGIASGVLFLCCGALDVVPLPRWRRHRPTPNSCNAF